MANWFQNIALGAVAVLGAGTMVVDEAQAQTGDSRVICNPTSGCGPGQGARGGAGTGVTDATVWAPVRLYEGTTVVNGKLHRDGHDLIPEVSIAGRPDLAHLDGRTFSIPIQPMPQGTRGTQRITVRFDATPDGDEIVVQAPRGFTNAGIAGLNGTQNGKTLRIAFRVCDYGQFIEPPPPAHTAPPPAPPAPPPAPPAPPPAPPAPPPAPPAPPPAPPAVVREAPDAPVAPPRIITSDADTIQLAPLNGDDNAFDFIIRGDGQLGGGTTNGTLAATGIYRDGRFQVRGGVTGVAVDGSPLGTVEQRQTIIITPAGPRPGPTETVEAGIVDGTQIAPLVTAMGSYDIVGDAARGDYLRIQGGIDPLAGAGASADEALVNAGDPVDPLTRAVFAQSTDSNVLAGGIEAGVSFGSQDQVRLTARGSVMRPLIGNGTMGLTDDLALNGEYFGNDANRWQWGYNVSGEARAQLSDSFSLTAGGTYDVFKYPDRSTAEVCGDCGFQYELLNKGDQTNLTAYVGADYRGERLQASGRVNWSRLTNVGGQTITGQVIEGDTAYFGEDLVGMNAQGIYGTGKLRYDFGDVGGWSAVARGSYGTWDLNRFSIERDNATAWRAEVGPRLDFNDGRAFIEATAGYQSVDTARGTERGPTARIGVGFRF